jgi:hypothetical protein
MKARQHVVEGIVYAQVPLPQRAENTEAADAIRRIKKAINDYGIDARRSTFAANCPERDSD